MDDRRSAVCACGRTVVPPRRRFCSYACLELGARIEKYGIDGAQFTQMWKAQGGRCPLCDLALDHDVIRPVVDHDHRTGRVRGLLCKSCNLRIGHIERTLGSSVSAEYTARAVAYLAGPAAGMERTPMPA